MVPLRGSQWVSVRINAKIISNFKAVLKMHSWNTILKQNNRVNSFENSKILLPLMAKQLWGLFSSNNTAGQHENNATLKYEKQKDTGVLDMRFISTTTVMWAWHSCSTNACLTLLLNRQLGNYSVVSIASKQDPVCVFLLELKTKHLLALLFVLWQPSS